MRSVQGVTVDDLDCDCYAIALAAVSFALTIAARTVRKGPVLTLRLQNGLGVYMLQTNSAPTSALSRAHYQHQGLGPSENRRLAPEVMTVPSIQILYA